MTGFAQNDPGAHRHHQDYAGGAEPAQYVPTPPDPDFQPIIVIMREPHSPAGLRYEASERERTEFYATQAEVIGWSRTRCRNARMWSDWLRISSR